MKKIILNKENPESTILDMSAEEITAINTHQTEIVAHEATKADVITAKATAQASGNTKLLDLGLSQAEATSLTGYTPPVEE